MSCTPEALGEGGLTVRSRWRALALAALSIVVALTFAPFYADSIADIDVWWHLGAGRWILQNGRLPAVDPFGVFGPGNPVRTATVLRGQWLGQVAMYATFARLGALGLVALRVALLAACLVVCHVRARRLGAGSSAATAVTALAGLGLLGFTGDRPQLFSFLLASVLMLLADELERSRRWVLLAIPAVGILWANFHGGALIGVAVLGSLAAVEGVRALAGADRTRVRDLLLATALFAGATLVSPNGLVTYAYVLQTQGGELASRTTEYVGALRVHGVGGWERQLVVFAYFGVAALALPSLVRSAPARAAALVFLAAASAASYRYHAFFVLMGAPWIAAALAVPGARLVPSPRHRWLAAGAAWAVAMGLQLWLHAPFRALREPVARGRFPDEAVERVRADRVGGRMLSWFGWSGYVLWQLSPAVRPFVDPRMLDDAALRPYTHMIWATPEGIAAFDAERFSFVLLPFVSPTGEAYPLHQFLRARSDWATEYVWAEGALYRAVRSPGEESHP